MRKVFFVILISFSLTSCSVHTFTYGDGPKQGYTKILKQIIKQNSLKDFDDVKLMPLSVKYKNLI